MTRFGCMGGSTESLGGRKIGGDMGGRWISRSKTLARGLPAQWGQSVVAIVLNLLPAASTANEGGCSTSSMGAVGRVSWSCGICIERSGSSVEGWRLVVRVAG